MRWPKKKESIERARTPGTARSPVFSYYQNREQDNRPRRDTPTPKNTGRSLSWLHHLPGYVAFAAIAGSLLYSMTLTGNPKIIIVNDKQQGVEPFLREKQTYQSVAQTHLKNSVLNKNKLTINTTSVAEHIKTDLPEATEVSITLPLIGRNPVVYIRVAEPLFLLSSDQAVFVVDDQGRAVVPLNEVADPKKLPLIRVADRSGVLLEPGKQVIPHDHVQFMQNLGNQLKTAGFTPVRYVLPARPNELHVYLKGKPYYLKTNFLLESRGQVGRLAAITKHLSNSVDKPRQYVDLRIDDRVYIR